MRANCLAKTSLASWPLFAIVAGALLTLCLLTQFSNSNVYVFASPTPSSPSTSTSIPTTTTTPTPTTTKTQVSAAEQITTEKPSAPRQLGTSASADKSSEDSVTSTDSKDTSSGGGGESNARNIHYGPPAAPIPQPIPATQLAYQQQPPQQQKYNNVVVPQPQQQSYGQRPAVYSRPSPSYKQSSYSSYKRPVYVSVRRKPLVYHKVKNNYRRPIRRRPIYLRRPVIAQSYYRPSASSYASAIVRPRPVAYATGQLSSSSYKPASVGVSYGPKPQVAYGSSVVQSLPASQQVKVISVGEPKYESVYKTNTVGQSYLPLVTSQQSLPLAAYGSHYSSQQLPLFNYPIAGVYEPEIIVKDAYGKEVVKKLPVGYASAQKVSDYISAFSPYGGLVSPYENGENELQPIGEEAYVGEDHQEGADEGDEHDQHQESDGEKEKESSEEEEEQVEEQESELEEEEEKEEEAEDIEDEKADLDGTGMANDVKGHLESKIEVVKEIGSKAKNNILGTIGALVSHKHGKDELNSDASVLAAVTEQGSSHEPEDPIEKGEPESIE